MVHLYLVRVRGESFDSVRLYGSLEPHGPERISLLGAGVGIIATAALVNLVGGRWVTPAGFGAITAWVLMARRWSKHVRPVLVPSRWAEPISCTMPEQPANVPCSYVKEWKSPSRMGGSIRYRERWTRT